MRHSFNFSRGQKTLDLGTRLSRYRSRGLVTNASAHV